MGDEQRPGCVLRSCGCVIAAVTLVIGATWAVNYWRTYTQRRDRTREETAAQEIRTTLQEFAARHAPDLTRALRELELLEADLKQRLEKLEELLRSVDREPRTDPDYQNWRQRLEEVRQAQEKLRNDIEEAYVVFRKFELAPDPSLRAQFEEALDRGRAAASQMRDRYQRLHEELSEEE